MSLEDSYYDFPEAVIRFFRKEADEADLAWLRRWLAESSENQRRFDEYQDLWLAMECKTGPNEYNPDAAWEKLFNNTTAQQKEADVPRLVRFPFWKNFLKIAAMIIVAFSAGAVTMHILSGKKGTAAAITEHVVPYGSRSVVTLPDGSKVWLNSGSRIIYSQDFNLGSREVTMEGEAYFDVIPNRKLPFEVNACDIKIKVLGTAFNVKAYPEENVIETTVERGKVNLLGRDKNLILTPRQRALVFKVPGKKMQDTAGVNVKREASSLETDKTKPVVLQKPVVEKGVNTEVLTSWKDKRWIIERETLGSLAIKLERRFDVKIHFSVERIKNYVFSGAFEDESLEQVLSIIRYTAPVSYCINKKNVILKENPFLRDNL